ncbi:MAG TPA: selenium metabolism-associated LysR family transcriptional regulator [Thermodesulfobacteriota bacterium]|nr:selenium metabolism-associated LysR family transcriptional regulator [Thermodesulfobacteriota bacterium]
MDFRRLEVFAQVYQLKSFSKAGQVLYLSQPTISEHVRLLEEDLGLSLFDREGKEILPTKAGERLYHYALQLLALRTESERAMSQFRDKSTGELVVGGSNIPGQYILPALLGKFKKLFPNISLRLLVGDSKNVQESLLEGSIEIGVVGVKADHRQISCQELVRDNLICIVPPGSFANHEIKNPKEITRLPFILREKGSGTRTAIEEALKKIHLDISDLQVVAEMGSNEAIRQAVKAGVGATIISRLAVRDDLKQGLFEEIRIKRFSIARKFFIITHQQRSLSPLALDFKEFLIGRHAYKDQGIKELGD